MLKGDRVLLRSIERSDLPRLWELIQADLEVIVLSRTKPAVPVSLAEFEAGYEVSSTQQSDRVMFAIEVDGEVIGQTGLHRIDHFNQNCELGIEIGRQYWSKGFGQDAVRTLVDYAFEHLNMNRIALQVLAEDPRAVGAYRKVGFVEEGRQRQVGWVRGTHEDVLVMAILREEWKPRSQSSTEGV
jgi:RimJ/RimL family protein N-acetyltransferase